MIDLIKNNSIFRRFMLYQVFSALGGGVFQFFMLLSVHMLYENPIYTGIASFLMLAPHFFAFAVGPAVDRANKVRVIRRTTLIEFAAVGLLAFVSSQGRVHVLFMFAVILLYTVAQVFETPAGSAFLRQIVDEDEIIRANSLVDIAATVGGLFVAALLFIALGGDVEHYWVYALSAVFVAVGFAATFSLKDTTARARTRDARMHSVLRAQVADLKEGIRYVRHTRFILYIIMAEAVAAFFIDIAWTNMPEFATTHVGARGYVVLMVVFLAGGLISSVLTGLLGDKLRVGVFICFVWILSGVLRIGFAHMLPISYIGGLAIMLAFSSIIGVSGMLRLTLMQKVPRENMVARVVTVRTTFISIAAALGALAGGFIGNIVSWLGHVFVLHGAAYILLGIALVLSSSIRKLPRINEINSEPAQPVAECAT